ncbi:hypothetical protein CITSP_03227 [Citrobacter sp. T1.2D-1]|nr:hypothetical protein CITSP_03227 [Citrobacter sp. T1.2D-1]
MCVKMPSQPDWAYRNRTNLLKGEANGIRIIVTVMIAAGCHKLCYRFFRIRQYIIQRLIRIDVDQLCAAKGQLWRYCYFSGQGFSAVIGFTRTGNIEVYIQFYH